MVNVLNFLRFDSKGRIKDTYIDIASSFSKLISAKI